MGDRKCIESEIARMAKIVHTRYVMKASTIPCFSYDGN